MLNLAKSIATIVVVFAAAFAVSAPVGATPTLAAGDQISWVAVEGEAPNPQPGAAFPVEMIIGAPDGNGFYPVLQLTAFNAAGRCISCGVQFDLTNLFLSQGQNELEISGSLTGISLSGVPFDVGFDGPSETWTYQAHGAHPVTITGLVDAPELVTVPEPTSLALLGTGLFGLALRRRYRF